ncbi:MAG: CoA-binding protein [Gemmatimonadetes bacterium]|nr:CoA-binding protein [Gemmatimonadota bacterium]
MDDWRAQLVEDDRAVRDLLASSRRIAVLGIKPESRSHKPAFSVPRFLQEKGYEIIPVPVYYPDVITILGRPIYRRLVDVPGPVDLVNVFRKPQDIPPHVPDLIAKAPRAVWFQLGIRNDEAARQLAEAGILVVQDRCTAQEHRDRPS